MGRKSRAQYLMYIGVFITCLAIYIHFQRVREGFTDSGLKPKGIILELIGGIGNQLYIYAAGKVMKKALNVPIYLILNMDTAFAHTSLDYRPIFFSDFEAIDSNSPPFQDKVDARVEQTFWDPWTPADIPKVDKYVYLHTQWYQHLPSIQTELPGVRDSVLQVLKKRYTDSLMPAGSAFIHVRRGDYLKEENKAYLLNTDYYLAALKHLTKRDNIKVIHIFSDDIAWCKQQGWDIPKEVRYVDDPDEIKVLYMMSQCTEGAVISNSTFSTWGALLGASQSGVVVYPSKWLYGAQTAFPSSWIRI